MLNRKRVRKCTCCQGEDHDIRTCEDPRSDNMRSKRLQQRHSAKKRKIEREHRCELLQKWEDQKTCFHMLNKDMTLYMMKFLEEKDQFLLACGIPMVQKAFTNFDKNYKGVFALTKERVVNGLQCYHCIKNKTKNNASIVQNFRKNVFGDNVSKTNLSFCIDCVLKHYVPHTHIFNLLDQNDPNMFMILGLLQNEEDLVEQYSGKYYISKQRSRKLDRQIQFFQKSFGNHYTNNNNELSG